MLFRSYDTIAQLLIANGKLLLSKPETETTGIETKSTDDAELIEKAKDKLNEIANTNMQRIMAFNLINTVTDKSIDSIVVDNEYNALIKKAKELLKSGESEETEETKKETEETKEPVVPVCP